jgi:hypothetical protein
MALELLLLMPENQPDFAKFALLKNWDYTE